MLWIILRNKGAIFVEEIEEIPENSVTIFSAHGVSEEVEKQAKQKNLQVIDATCPLVKRVHTQAQKFESSGNKVILIGHKKHPEVEGTSGRVKQDVFVVEKTSGRGSSAIFRRRQYFLCYTNHFEC